MNLGAHDTQHNIDSGIVLCVVKMYVMLSVAFMVMPSVIILNVLILSGVAPRPPRHST
jgi:hypothetical protein